MIHPGALAVLAEVMVEAGLRTQVIVTTHSPDLIDHVAARLNEGGRPREWQHEGWPRVGGPNRDCAGRTLHVRGAAQHGGAGTARMTPSAPGIVPIVEGRGDVKALPILLRRVLHERMGKYDVVIKKPKLAKEDLVCPRDSKNSWAMRRKTRGCAGILVLLDSDKDCPRELAAELALRARDSGVGIPIAVVCAKPEYENWFLASDEAFMGDVEEFGGAKDWLTRRMTQGLAYKPTKDQPSLSTAMDIEAAFHASRSFRRLCNAVKQLVDCIDSGTVSVTPCP